MIILGSHYYPNAFDGGNTTFSQTFYGEAGQTNSDGSNHSYGIGMTAVTDYALGNSRSFSTTIYNYNSDGGNGTDGGHGSGETLGYVGAFVTWKDFVSVDEGFTVNSGYDEGVGPSNNYSATGSFSHYTHAYGYQADGFNFQQIIHFAHDNAGTTQGTNTFTYSLDIDANNTYSGTYQQPTSFRAFTVPSTGSRFLIGQVTSETDTTISVITGTTIYDPIASTTGISTTTTVYPTITATDSFLYQTYTYMGVSGDPALVPPDVNFYDRVIPEFDALNNDWVWYSSVIQEEHRIDPSDPWLDFTSVYRSINGPIDMVPQEVQRSSVVPKAPGGPLVFPSYGNPYGINYLSQVSTSTDTTWTQGFDGNSVFPMPELQDSYTYNPITSSYQPTFTFTFGQVGTYEEHGAVDSTGTMENRGPPISMPYSIYYRHSDGVISTASGYSNIWYQTFPVTVQIPGSADAEPYFTSTNIQGDDSYFYQEFFSDIAHTVYFADRYAPLTFGFDGYYYPTYILQWSNEHGGATHQVSGTATHITTSNTYLSGWRTTTVTVPDYTLAGFRYQIPPYINATDPVYAGISVFNSFGNPGSFFTTTVDSYPSTTTTISGYYQSACAGTDVLIFMSLDPGTFAYSNTIYSLNLHDTEFRPYNANSVLTVNYSVTDSTFNGTTTAPYTITSGSFVNQFIGISDIGSRANVGFRVFDTFATAFTDTPSPVGGAPKRYQDPVTIVAQGAFETHDAYGSSGRTTWGQSDAPISETFTIESTRMFYPIDARVVKTGATTVGAYPRYAPYFASVYQKNTFQSWIDE